MRYDFSVMSPKTLLIAAVAAAAVVLLTYLLSQPLLPLEKPFRIPSATPPPWGDPPLPTPTSAGSTGSPQASPGQPTPTPPPSPSPTATPESKTYHIIMDKKGFTPSELTVKIGDTVVFDNKDAREHWPASDLHPTHLLCLGFGSQGGIAPGASYAYTFTEAKTCTMHDHLAPGLKGEIRVLP